MRPTHAALVATLLLGLQARAADLKCFGPDARTGTSAAVLADDAPQVHTAQLLPLDTEGRVVGKGKAAEQAARLLDDLDAALREAGSGLGRVAKLNVYAANPEAVADFEKASAGRFKGPHRPAVTFVVTRPPHPDALVALDAVALGGAKSEGRGRRWAVLPAGARVYVSGQAEKGDGLADATRKTLAGLRATLEHLGLKPADVVQAKAFLTPMKDVAAARKELAGFFGGRPPALAFVEWESSLPVEIELVVAAGKARPGAALEYITPPKMAASPVFSRVARINHGPTIYVGGIGGKADTPAAEVADAFAALKRVVGDAGGDLRHLAKATYYVTDDPVSRALNELRPKYYDARRPPAASKAKVAGTGRAGSLALDMIAVPAPKTGG